MLLKKRNVRSSAGILEDPDNYKAIVTISEYENLEELRNTVIRAGFDRNQILLRDVARVNKVFPEPTSYQRANSKPAIVLYINKTSASDIVKTTQTVKAFLEKNAENFLPQGITWFEFFDEGDEVNKVSRVLITNGVIGFCVDLIGFVSLFGFYYRILDCLRAAYHDDFDLSLYGENGAVHQLSYFDSNDYHDRHVS